MMQSIWLAILLFAPLTQVSGNPQQPWENEENANQSTGATNTGSRRPPPPPKEPVMPPEIQIRAMSWDALKGYELEQVLITLHELYKLDNHEIDLARQFSDKIQQERWNATNTSDLQKWLHTVDQRSQYVSDYFSQRPGNQTAALWAQLNKDKQMAEFNRQIEDFEKQHPWRLVERLPDFEKDLPAQKVAQAREDWDMRLAKARGRIFLKALTEIPSPAIKPVPVTNGNASSTEPKAGQVATSGKQLTVSNRAEANRTHNQAPNSNGKPAAPGKTTTPHPAEIGPVRPLTEWEKYVQEFIARHELDESQKNAALSILKDATARGVQIQKVNEPKISAANQMQDARAKSKQLEELKKPVDDLFRELQRRLDNLLTAAQRSRGNPTNARPSGRR